MATRILPGVGPVTETGSKTRILPGVGPVTETAAESGIDTAEKRRSISGIWLPFIPGVTPNASKDAEWRAQSGWSYSGIAADSPAGGIGLPIMSDDIHSVIFGGLVVR